MLIFYDTCSLINHFKEIFDEGEVFYVSSLTINELENIKTSGTKDEETKYNARCLLHKLKENKDKCVIIPFRNHFLSAIEEFDLPNTTDSKIIATAFDFYKNPEMEYPSDKKLFCTDDLACETIARSVGLPIFTFEDDDEERYTGYKEIEMDDETLAEFYNYERQKPTNSYNLVINQYLIIKQNGKQLSNGSFVGMCDIIKRVAYYFEGNNGEHVIEKEIPAELKDKCESYRSQLLEKLADFDDDFMMKVLEGEEPSIEEIKRVLRKAVCSATFFPVLCGSAYKNKGVQPLLDAVVDYLPSPLDVPATKGTDPNTGDEIERKASDDEPFAALAFKIVADPFVGKLAFFRVYSGHAEAGSYIYNSSKGQKERLGRIVQMHANNRQDITEVFSGDIAAAVGLKSTGTGDTLCDEEHEIILESMVFPEPVISQAIEPKSRGDQDKLTIALSKLAEEDPTFKAYTNHETGQTIIAGMGELHLDIIVDRMKREFKVECNVGAPQVAYKETIRNKVKAQGKFIRQSGGKGQYGDVWFDMEPLEAGSGIIFENKIVGGAVPKEFIKPTEDGMREAAESGILAGYPVIDFKCTLVDGSYHEVDSSEMAFKIAGSMAIKEGCRKAKAVILEPIMKVEITVPEEYMGDVIGDVNSRRGKMEGMEARNGMQIVKALHSSICQIHTAL
mgnify:CR=1 FL=1